MLQKMQFLHRTKWWSNLCTQTVLENTVWIPSKPVLCGVIGPKHMQMQCNKRQCKHLSVFHQCLYSNTVAHNKIYKHTVHSTSSFHFTRLIFWSYFRLHQFPTEEHMGIASADVEYVQCVILHIYILLYIILFISFISITYLTETKTERERIICVPCDNVTQSSDQIECLCKHSKGLDQTELDCLAEHNKAKASTSRAPSSKKWNFRTKFLENFRTLSGHFCRFHEA